MSWVLLPLALVVALACFQLLSGITVYAWATILAALYWAGNLACVFVALQVFADRDRRILYLDALLWFGTAVALLSTVQAATSEGMIYWTFPDPLVPPNIFGPFLYGNQFAAFIELTLPLAIYNAITRRRGTIWFVVAVAIQFGSVVYSSSRAGSALVLLEIVFVCILAGRRTETSGKQFLKLGGVLAVAVLWIWVVAGPDRLITKASTGNQLAGRSEFTRSSFEMIKARPLQGFGLGNWATAYPGFASFDDGTYSNQAHNDWAQWTAEGGIPMLLLMLSVAVWAIPRAVRSVWGLGVVAIFIHCLVDYPIQRTGVAIVFFTMMAAVAPYGTSPKMQALPEPVE